MSELRKHLERAREEHRQVRYPGDLAADLLGSDEAAGPRRLGYGTTPRRSWVFWANVGALGAVAACVAIVMFRAAPTSVGPPSEVAVVTPLPLRAEDEFSVVPELAGASLVPSGGGVVVPVSEEAAAVVPAMPSFPSLSDVLNTVEASEETNIEEST